MVGLAIAGVIAALAAAFASGDPDGLDSVAIEKGFEEVGKEPGFQILPDYTIPGLDGTMSTVIAGHRRDRHRLRARVPARAPAGPPAKGHGGLT